MKSISFVPAASSVTVAAGLAAAALTVAAPAQSAVDDGPGRGGPSTPNANVVAVHTGASPSWFVATDPEHPDRPVPDLQMTLTARTDRSAVPAARLRVTVDGLEVRDFEVHRVAVGSTECGGHEGTEPVVVAEEGHEEGVRAVVRGVGVLEVGGAGLQAGEPVQVWIDLEDRSSAAFADRGRVRVRPAPHQDQAAPVPAEHEDGDSCTGGGQGGWTYDTMWMPLQQVVALSR